jgi:hypothetical protein
MGHITNWRLHAHTERTPVGKTHGVPSWSRLCSPGVNEDGPTVMTMAPPTTIKHGGTCELPNR